MNVLIYSPRYFPTYVGGGERLAQLTAAGLRAEGAGVAILTDGAPSEYVFDDVTVHVAPTNESSHLTQLFQRLRPNVVHLIGAWGKPEVVRAARSVGARFGAAGLDYGQFCDNHLLIRGSGALCPGRTSAADCFRCGLEAASARDRWLGQVGRWVPEQVADAATATAQWALGRPMGSQLELSRRFEIRDAARRAGTESLDLFVVPTQFAQSKSRPHLSRHTRCESLMYPRTNGLARVPKRTSAHELGVGFIGRALPMKGLHVLLDAFDAVVQEGVPAKLKIVAATNAGEAESYWAPLKARVAANSHIEWRESGVLDASALKSFHADVDVLAVPSVWPEYVGFVTLEALALGTRVILSDFPTQRELLRDDASGLFVTPGDVKSLAGALSACWRFKRSGDPGMPKCPAPSAAEYAHQLLRFYDGVAA